jgi:hypothetical protein
MAKTKGEAPTKNKEKAPAKPEEESWARVEEEAARARIEDETRIKAEHAARAKAEEKARVRTEKEALAKADQEGQAKAEEAARVRVEQEARIKAEEEARLPESATPATIFHTTGFEAIAAETIDYSKKSLANGSAIVGKLLGAKSFESAIYTRSEYARTSYADFVAYLKKIGELNTKLAKEAFKRHSHVA